MRDRDQKRQKIWLIFIGLVFVVFLVIIILTPLEKQQPEYFSDSPDTAGSQVLLDDTEIFSKGPSNLPPANPLDLLRWAFKFQEKNTFL